MHSPFSSNSLTTPEKKQVAITFPDLMTSGQADRFGQVLAANYHQHNPAVKDGLRGIQEQELISWL